MVSRTGESEIMGVEAGGGACGAGGGAEGIMEGQDGEKLLGTFGTWMKSWFVTNQICN